MLELDSNSGGYDSSMILHLNRTLLNQLLYTHLHERGPDSLAL